MSKTDGEGALEFKSLGDFNAIAKIGIGKDIFWRWRINGRDLDSDLENFKSLADFESHILKFRVTPLVTNSGLTEMLSSMI